jgi:hypothetical protein
VPDSNLLVLLLAGTSVLLTEDGHPWWRAVNAVLLLAALVADLVVRVNRYRCRQSAPLPSTSPPAPIL